MQKKSVKTKAKKSLGQNFLVDKNVLKKIVDINLINDETEIVEIGPGTGNLTDYLINKNPKKIFIIEKDQELSKNLLNKFFGKAEIINKDILKFFDYKIFNKNTVIIGNLPYNISSQILVKIIRFKRWPPNFENLIFMFQKELGEKILGACPSVKYGRLSILANYRLNFLDKFLVSKNCFFPKPKVTSMVILFKPKLRKLNNIKNILNLEKITNLFFSNKRKMINKTIKKILNEREIKSIIGLKSNSRPSEIKPETYYKITELFEKK